MKYSVKLYPRAYRDLDSIYSYIADNLMEKDTADHMITDLENAVFSLEQFPERGSIRRTGTFANQLRLILKQIITLSKAGPQEKPGRSLSSRRV